jgi:hypothetical protein
MMFFSLNLDFIINSFPPHHLILNLLQSVSLFRILIVPPSNIRPLSLSQNFINSNSTPSSPFTAAAPLFHVSRQQRYQQARAHMLILVSVVSYIFFTILAFTGY